MNGLTAANVDHLVEAIKDTIARGLRHDESSTVIVLESVLSMIEEMQRYNTTQPSRPDRVGDECWYGTWERGIGWQWRRGILRAWVPGDCPAVVEDVEAKKVECYSMISFSTEAPA
jgi:phenylpyruvate tautomerase PptA (4-oxalocrotonate tautomerase family)